MDQETKKEFDDLAKIIKEGFDQTATKGEFEELRGDFENVDSDLGHLKSDLEYVKGDLEHVKNQMVTKDYLDEKLSDLRGDLTVLMRKEDHKVLRLIGILKNKNILVEEDVRELLEMEPFPKASL